ncbi:MAG: FAD-dependent monooxygenase, partial [Paraperlucidibaca sp.]
MARLSAAEENVDSFGYVVENAWLGSVLLAALRQCPSVRVLDGVRVTHVASAAECAQVRYSHANDDVLLSPRLLIAADGAQSQSRAWLGIDVRSQAYGQTAIVTACETSLPHQQVAYERFTADGPIALLPLPDLPVTLADATKPGCRRSLVWALSDAEAERIQALDDAAFMVALQQAFGRRAGRFVRVGQRHAYPLALMVAAQQVQGRAVILGNAAHSLHPVAGQGYNLCVRDALVLSAQLAAAHQHGKDIGDASDLAAYAAAREQDQSQIIRFSDSLVRGFSSANPALSVLRNIGLVGFDVLPGAKPALARYAMGLNHA